MKKLLLPAGLLAIAPFAVADSASDKIKFYGKANVSWQYVNEDDDTYSELISNASRLGVKGSVAIDDGLTGIYQIEIEVDEDGDGDLFKQRNTYVGLKGGFGQVIAGKFDTALKKAQKKVDLFSDLEGDIKSVITRSENRMSNSVQYSTPSMSGVKVVVDFINSEDEDVNNGISTSVSYSNDTFYVAGAYDQDVEAEDVSVARAVGQVYLGPVTLGLLYESDDNDIDTKNGSLFSLKYKVSSEWVLKGQVGASDIKYEDTFTSSVGADYKVAKNAKFFGYVTQETYDYEGGEVDNVYAGVGIELKF